MYRVLSALAVVLLICSNATAQSKKWVTKTVGNYTYKTVEGDPMQMRFYTLKNGLTVILSVNRETPRVQTLIATKAGSKTDPATNTGLAHYLEHMLFKGTDKYGSLNWEEEKKHLETIDNLYEQYNSTKDEAQRKAIYRQIDSVSGVAAKFAIANEYDKMMTSIGAKGTNAFTSNEQTVYVNDIPANKISQWLAVEAERFRNPVLRIFHTELEAVYEEKNRALDNDGRKVNELLMAELFKKHNYGLQSTLGTVEHLKNPSLKEIRKYFYKNYVPNNMAVIMVGDINPDVLIAQIDKAFSYMQAKPVEPYRFEPEDEITSPRYGEVLGPDAEYLNIAYRFPGATSKDATMLNFMSNVLSNGTAGLMDLNLVKKQKVLSAGAGADIMQDYSILYISGRAKEGQKLEEVRDEILGQIQLLKDGNFDDALLNSIINNYKKQMIDAAESNGGRAYSALDAFVTGVDWAESVAQVAEMSKITKADVQAFCKKWLNDNYVCIYKRIGKDNNVVKVDKPSITPVEVNRDAQSNFVRDVINMQSAEMPPVYVDFNKDIARGKLKTVPVLSVKNTTNNTYSLYYYLDIGEWHNQLLPLAVDYLQYLGTKTKSADDVSRAFYQTASDFGVSSGREETYVYLTGLQENFAADVARFEDLLANCEANDEALQEMIAGMKKKRADSKRNKGAIRNALSNYARYGADNPFNYVLSDEQLDAITPKQLVDILRSLTKYNHKVLYYGPLANAQLVKVLTPLHKVPASFLPTPALHKFNFSQQKDKNVLFTNYDMVQSEITWVRNGDAYDEAAIPVIQLFNEYFGGSMSGIVFQDIRESKALAYSTMARYNTPAKKEDPFSTTAYVGCQADKLKESIIAMNAILNKLPQSDKSFQQAQQSILTNINTTRITKMGLIFSYLNAQKLGQTNDIRQRVYKEVPAYSFADVNRFFEQNIAGKPYTLCVVGKEEKLDWEELNKHGAVTKLSLKELFGY
jgi:predicted Zn-dependent peptidase